jgi:hypothetical protein
MTSIMPSYPEIWGRWQICTTDWQEGRNKNFVTAVATELPAARPITERPGDGLIKNAPGRPPSSRGPSTSSRSED